MLPTTKMSIAVLAFGKTLVGRDRLATWQAVLGAWGHFARPPSSTAWIRVRQSSFHARWASRVKTVRLVLSSCGHACSKSDRLYRRERDRGADERSASADDCVVVLAVSSERVSGRKTGNLQGICDFRRSIFRIRRQNCHVFSSLPTNSLRTGTGNFRFGITEAPVRDQAIVGCGSGNRPTRRPASSGCPRQAIWSRSATSSVTAKPSAW